MILSFLSMAALRYVRYSKGVLKNHAGPFSIRDILWPTWLWIVDTASFCAYRLFPCRSHTKISPFRGSVCAYALGQEGSAHISYTNLS